MDCRKKCGACCIAPSITQPYFGMPNGKKAGEICTHLDMTQFSCRIWGTANYPKFCHQFAPERWVCGDSREQALLLMGAFEISTAASATATATATAIDHAGN